MKFVTGRLSTSIGPSGGVALSFSTETRGEPSVHSIWPPGAGSYDAQMSTQRRSPWFAFRLPRTELPGSQSPMSCSSRQPSLIASPRVISLATGSSSAE